MWQALIKLVENERSKIWKYWNFGGSNYFANIIGDMNYGQMVLSKHVQNVVRLNRYKNV